MEAEATFREAGAGDIPTLARHRRLMYEDMRRAQAFDYRDVDLDTMEDQYQKYLLSQMPQGAMVAKVAEVQGRIVASGAVSILAWPPAPGWPAHAVGLLHSMYTAPEWRKRGMGRSIINALMVVCKAKGCRQLIMGGRGTDMGRHLYEMIGFRPSENMRLNL